MTSKVTVAFPEFSAELASLLRKSGHEDLAGQVADLSVRDRCRCGDSFCGMFYTAPRSQEGWGLGHENIALNPEQGMIILDVVQGRIAAVEVLYRDEFRARLLELMP